MPGSGNVLVDAIAGIGWLSGTGDNHVTYYFDNSLGFHSWTAAEKASYAAAIQQFVNVAHVTVEEVFALAGADLDENWVSDAYMQSHHGNFGGWHEPPPTGAPADGHYNAGRLIWTLPNALAPGGFAFELFMHEVGHGFGLAHPHDMSMGTPKLPGVTSELDPGDFEYNQTLYTVMSYNIGPYQSAPSLEYGHAETLKAFDIAALQFLYGANTTYRSGDDVYLLPDVDLPGTGWACIWDTGGNDTIRYDGAADAVIDLRAATLVYGDLIAGGAVSRVGSIFGGFTIANGVVIENAMGGSGDDVLTGNGADNRFDGGLGDDSIDGGAGDDTALFSQDLASYTLEDLGSRILVVVGADGTDTLSAIEHLAFTDGTFTPVDDGSALFDSLYYLSRNPDVRHAGVGALDHFHAYGWHEGRDPNRFFDVSGYLAVNKDVAASGVNPLDHYHETGWHQGRDPSASFDTTLYLLRNPDVAAAGIDPLEHYLMHGKVEGRQSYHSVGSNIVGGFDAEYYLFHNPDVAAAGVDPLAHFNSNGWHEGRNPNAYFDTAGYLAHYIDVAAAGINPLAHYEAYGWQEGRDPSAIFDTQGYLAANPDVAAAHINPLNHFLMDGIYEGRTAANDGVWG